MSPRQASRVGVLILICAAALLETPIGGTSALYEGSTENASSTFAAGWVNDATAMSATPEGYDVSVGWTPGAKGVTAQKIYGEDKTTSESCTSVPTPALSATLASASTSSYKDESRGTEANDGDWFCYELQGTRGSWTSPGAFKAVQLGLVASAVTTTNESTKCESQLTKTEKSIDCDDTIAITFNQKPTLPASPIDVCVFSGGTIVLGDTETETKKKETLPACKAATDPYNIGKLTISAGSTIGASVAYTKSPYTLSEAAPWKMTIKLEGSTSSAAVTGSPTWTFTPASTIKSSIKTHEATICTAEKSTCRPKTTTDF